MTLFLGTWQIMDSERIPCMTYFGSMTKKDDENESEGVEIIGRWGDLGCAKGAMICRAKSYEKVANWIYNWVPMANCKIKPICDDNTAREIILGRKPDYQVNYSYVNDEPTDGEILYMINYKFHLNKKMEGYNAFALLSEEEDKKDAGNCRCLGRWHDIGTGSGMAIAIAKNEGDIYSWAYHWTGMCECEITPVLTDNQSRKIIKSKPDYQKKLNKVLKIINE